jgi:hypothetical protein
MVGDVGWIRGERQGELKRVRQSRSVYHGQICTSAAPWLQFTNVRVTVKPKEARHDTAPSDVVRSAVG